MKTKNENARAAIISKFSGPTNTRGARILVKSQRGSKSFDYPYDLSGADCHIWAVAQYLEKIAAEDLQYGSPVGWGVIGDYSVGVIPSGEYVFVSNN
jgi:hypothetical protein